MVVYGTVTGVSVGGLFAGGVSSGLLLSFLYCVYILIRSFLNKNICPAMPKEDQLPFKENLKRLRKVIIPIVLVMSVLGSIFGGIATPTEAAAVGSSTALLIAFFRRRLTLNALTNALISTAKTTAMVGFIFTSAQFFGQVFVATGGNKFVMELAGLIPFGAYGVLFITMLIVFFLGCFLETIAIVIICAPIFTPLILASGIDPLWFGILFMVNIQTAYLSPPFGMSLYFMKGAVSKDFGIALKDIFIAALPFLALQIVGLLMCIAFPVFAMWGTGVLM
jgi:tripartite ATP-independent transporter DctM subunit